MSEDKPKVIKLVQVKPDSSEAESLLRDALEMAQEGKIAAIGVGIILDDKRNWFDTCADQPINPDQLAGLFGRMQKHIFDTFEEN